MHPKFFKRVCAPPGDGSVDCGKLYQRAPFYSASYASTVLAVIVCLSVRPSVRLSVCHKSELYKDG